MTKDKKNGNSGNGANRKEKLRNACSMAIAAFFVLALASCTDNQRARNFGGIETVKLEPNERFINLTWKESDLWIIVQDTVTGTYYAREKSSYGVWQGKVIIEK